MRYTFIFILLVKFSNFCCAQNVIVIDSDYGNSFKKPILAERNTLYKFEADSIFLVNSQRMLMYETVINQYLNDSLGKTASNMARFFEQNLRQFANEYDKLHRNANETQRISEIFIDSTRRVINQSILALDNAQMRLNDSHKNLDIAIHDIKQQRSKTLLTAIAAVAIGIGFDRIFIK